MSTDFSPVAYRSLLAALLDRGYDVRGYADAVPDQRHLILRHDIDLSLDAALPIAEIERALGLKAHYFVLVRTELYNLFSAAGRDALRRLTALGHDIGLHLDASLYDNATAMLGKAAEEECAVLAAATGAPVTVISFHRPAQALLGYPDTLAGRVHAYQPRFFTQMGYCSDSPRRLALRSSARPCRRARGPRIAAADASGLVDGGRRNTARKGGSFPCRPRGDA